MERHHSRRTSRREPTRHRAPRRMPRAVPARSVQRARQHPAAADEPAAARPRLRSVTPRAVLAGLAAAGLVGAATVAWLLVQAGGAPPATLAQTRIDAVRTGLTAAA